MKSVTAQTAKTLVAAKTVSKAVIECFDGRRWAIVLKGGKEEFVVRSVRHNPKAFAKIETALVEVKEIGLNSAEVDMAKWHREQSTLV